MSLPDDISEYCTATVPGESQYSSVLCIKMPREYVIVYVCFSILWKYDSGICPNKLTVSNVELVLMQRDDEDCIHFEPV